MLNRVTTAVVRTSLVARETQMLAPVRRRGIVYHSERGQSIGFNVGTTVRPEVSRIRVNTRGDETVESFLARGGRILVGRPKVAKGALLVNTINIATKGGRNRTGQIVRRVVQPQTITSSSVVSLAREQRPYNGSAMKMFGPTN